MPNLVGDKPRRPARLNSLSRNVATAPDSGRGVAKSAAEIRRCGVFQRPVSARRAVAARTASGQTRSSTSAVPRSFPSSLFTRSAKGCSVAAFRLRCGACPPALYAKRQGSPAGSRVTSSLRRSVAPSLLL